MGSKLSAKNNSTNYSAGGNIWQKIFRLFSLEKHTIINNYYGTARSPEESKEVPSEVSHKPKPDWFSCDMHCPICDNLVSMEEWKQRKAIKIASTFYHKDCLIREPLLSDSLDGWKLLCFLGKDSFGQYYVASKEEQIKVIHEMPSIREEHKDSGQWPRMIERLERGFDKARELSSKYPNDLILPGQVLKSEQRNCYYYLMPYYPAWTLKQLIDKTRGGFPPKAISYVMQWLSQILVHLKEAGIVHRDIKPAHILWCADGSLKLTGFCLLKPAKEERNLTPLETATQDAPFEMYSQSEFSGNQESSEPLTASGRFLGTPAYSAPEQIHDAVNASEKADIWSSGVVLLELLTRYNPFDRGKDIRLSLNAVNRYRGISDVSRYLTKVSPEWIKILEMFLAQAPGKRADAEEIQEAIESLDGDIR